MKKRGGQTDTAIHPTVFTYSVDWYALEPADGIHGVLAVCLGEISQHIDVLRVHGLVERPQATHVLLGHVLQFLFLLHFRQENLHEGGREGEKEEKGFACYDIGLITSSCFSCSGIFVRRIYIHRGRREGRAWLLCSFTFVRRKLWEV